MYENFRFWNVHSLERIQWLVCFIQYGCLYGRIWLRFIMYIFIKYKRVQQNVKTYEKKPQPWQITTFIIFTGYKNEKLWWKKTKTTGKNCISVNQCLLNVNIMKGYHEFNSKIAYFSRMNVDMLIFAVAQWPLAIYLRSFHNSLWLWFFLLQRIVLFRSYWKMQRNDLIEKIVDCWLTSFDIMSIVYSLCLLCLLCQCSSSIFP